MDITLAIEHIVRDPDKRGGRPRIDGTGITVHDIAGDYSRGMKVEQMVEAFDLTAGQVHAALSYYFDHKEEIDQEISDSEARAHELIQELTRQGRAISADELRRRIESRKANQ